MALYDSSDLLIKPGSRPTDPFELLVNRFSHPSGGGWRDGTTDWRFSPRVAGARPLEWTVNFMHSTVTQNTRKRLLELAIARVGRAHVAAYLRVPVVVMEDWLDERWPMPDEKLVVLVNLLDETNG